MDVSFIELIYSPTNERLSWNLTITVLFENKYFPTSLLSHFTYISEKGLLIQRSSLSPMIGSFYYKSYTTSTDEICKAIAKLSKIIVSPMIGDSDHRWISISFREIILSIYSC